MIIGGAWREKGGTNPAARRHGSRRRLRKGGGDAQTSEEAEAALPVFPDQNSVFLSATRLNASPL